MGFFDSKWIVEFEYSEGFFSSYKKATMVVEESSEYGAKRRAKTILNESYKYVNILSIHKSSGIKEEKSVTYKPSYKNITQQKSSSKKVVSSSDYRKNKLNNEEYTWEQQKLKATQYALASLIEKKENIVNKKKEIKKIKISPIRNTIIGAFISLCAFVFGWFPFCYFKAMEDNNRFSLEIWIRMGYSSTDNHGQEIVAAINQYHALSNGVLFIPFVILVIGIVISVIVYFTTKKKVPQKLTKAQEELDVLEKQ